MPATQHAGSDAFSVQSRVFQPDENEVHAISACLRLLHQLQGILARKGRFHGKALAVSLQLTDLGRCATSGFDGGHARLLGIHEARDRIRIEQGEPSAERCG